MRALVWIVEDTWEAAVDAAGAQLPPDAEITLLHVVRADAEGAVRAVRQGLLGRAHPPRGEPSELLRAVAEEAAGELLAQAGSRLGRPARLELRRGRSESEVLAAAAEVDLLVLARDGDRARLGPRSLGAAARFVLDHAPCSVLLVWPGRPPSVHTIPPQPR
jgi:nucleotide-binding universal stress UspA family protein